MTHASPVNIAIHLPKMAQQQPNRVAVYCPNHRSANATPNYTQITYKQLESQSNCIASGLLASGIKRGDRVVLMVTPSQEFFALVFAMFKIGAVMVCIDPGIGTKNLGKCIEEAQPSAYIGIPKAQLARVILRWGRSSIQTKITVGPGLGLTLKKIIKRGTDTAIMADTTTDESAAILFTSGSTGIPKASSTPMATSSLKLMHSSKALTSSPVK